MEFKGTKEKFKIQTATTQGTPMCLPNNTIYAGKIRLAQVFGNTVEEATANAILLSKSKDMLNFLIKLKQEWEEDDLRYGGENFHMEEITNLIKQATEL